MIGDAAAEAIHRRTSFERGERRHGTRSGLRNSAQEYRVYVSLMSWAGNAEPFSRVLHGGSVPHHDWPARRRVVRFLAWVGVAVVLLAGAGASLVIDTSSQTPSGRSVDARAVSFVSEQLKAQGSPVSAFAVMRGAEITKFGALGEGVTVDTPFPIGSLSKSFTALAVMQLVDQGLVGLDDPVTMHISWFRTADPAAVITVRQLLNQTSGLPTWAGTSDVSEPDTASPERVRELLEQRVRAVADVPLAAQPGAEFHYSNTNYAVLGLMVEEVSGIAFADYLRQRILGPLGMDRTFTSVADARQSGMVEGAEIWFGVHLSREPVGDPGALPDGGLVSTVADLARYVAVQRDGTHAGRRIISEESLQQLHDGHVADDVTYGYAFGWEDVRVERQRVIQHAGDVPTYHADLGMLKTPKAALVVLTAHNGLFYQSAPYAGGMHVLAGGSTPAIDRTYLFFQTAIVAIAIVELVLLIAGTVGLVRRISNIRRSDQDWLRMVGLPALGYLGAGGVIAAVVLFAIWQFYQDKMVLAPNLLFSVVPDLSTMVVVGVGWLALAGIITLCAGFIHRAEPT